MAANLRSQKQGDQDRACGFYSIGNAIHWLCPGLDVDEIFHHVFHYYYKNISSDHFHSGMGRNTLNQLLEATIRAVAKDGARIGVRRPFWKQPAGSLGRFRGTLLEHFSQEYPVASIIGYEYCQDARQEPTAHWTVIRGVTSKTLRTFDSDCENEFIRFSRCRVGGNLSRHKSRPYLLWTTGTFLLQCLSDDAG